MRGRVRRRRLQIAVVSVLALLIGAALPTWIIGSARIASGVGVSWEPRCADVAFTDRAGRLLLAARRGWRCRIEVTITNSSSRGITVTGLESPILGTRGGGEIMAIPTDGAPVVDFDMATHATVSSGVDARWPVELTVPAGSSRSVEVAVGWRQAGCNSAGRLWLDNWPSVAFTALGRTHRAGSDRHLVLRTYDDAHDARACSV